MKRLRRNITAWTLAGILCCAPFAGGCDPINWIGPNLGLDIIVPLGMGGSPGLFNPFGIVQAIVNGMLGSNTSGDANAYTTPTAATGSTAETFNPAVTTVLP